MKFPPAPPRVPGTAERPAGAATTLTLNAFFLVMKLGNTLPRDSKVTAPIVVLINLAVIVAAIAKGHGDLPPAT